MYRSFHFGELNRIKTASSKLAVIFTKLASSALLNTTASSKLAVVFTKLASSATADS